MRYQWTGLLMTGLMSALVGMNTVASQGQLIGQAVKKQKTNNHLKGPVQVVEEKVVQYHESILKRTPIGTVTSWIRTTFNNVGAPIERTAFGRDGLPESKETLRYNERGNLIEIVSLGRDGVLRISETQDYDERGNQIERTTYDSEGSIKIRVRHKYDLNNRLVEEIRYQPSYAHIANGNSVKTIISYEDQHREKEELKYDGSGRLILRWLIKYNPDGTEKEETCENPARGYSVCPCWKRVYRYDNQGNKTEQGSYEKNSGVYKIDFLMKYDEQGNQTEFDQPGHLRIVYKYSAGGIKTESSAFNREGRLVTKTKYDSTGSETIRTGLRGGILEKNFYDREYDAYDNLIRKTWHRKTISQSVRAMPASEWLVEDKDKGKILEVLEYNLTYYK